MRKGREELVAVLREARDWLSRPDNDFSWSYWQDAEQALREVDALIAATETGLLPPVTQLSVLFLPTGPVQEVSLSSGWGDEFLALADRFDRAQRTRREKEPQMDTDAHG